MNNIEQHQELIETKKSIYRKAGVFFIRIISIGFLIVIGTLIYYNKEFAASFSVFSAAIVFALQNFVASMFAYFYIKSTGIYTLGDIIKSGNPFMPINGEVIDIGLFFTKVKEVDGEELTFTGKIDSFPNYLIFNGGVMNYTKNNLLFWHEMNINISIKNKDPEESISKIKTSVEKMHKTSLNDDIYINSELQTAKNTKPKYKYQITDKGLELKIRILVHFYRVFDINNKLSKEILSLHQKGEIEIMFHKDYQ